MNIVLLGAPGSGKGTQASMLSKKFNIPVLSTGECLRKEISQKSEIGEKISSYVELGSLVPDQIVLEVISSQINQLSSSKGLIFDGFPRNVSQAKFLEKTLFENKATVNKVFLFDIKEKDLLFRISGRFSCAKCGLVYNSYLKNPINITNCDDCGGHHFKKRFDDNFKTVRNRFSVYKESSEDLIEFYRKKGLLTTIPVLGDRDKVFDLLLSEVQT